MSLMLDALKRIAARQMPGQQRTTVPPREPIALSRALPADVSPGLAPQDFGLPEPVLLEETMDQLQAFLAEAGSLDNAQSGGDRADRVDRAELPKRDPPIAEAASSDPYAATAQQILRQLPQGQSQVLLFTSSADGQGKTVTLARLAPRLARGMQGRVLVVDANFRNPDMARCLDVAPEWRLPDVLAHAADWAAAVRTTAYDRVSLLPGGADAPGRGTGRNIQGVSQLLRVLARHYELVVVDAASLAHRGTVQLAAACDAAYLVVRLGEGSPRMLREAVRVLQRNGGRLLGCVAVA
jgi:Mrp family chromosome partitioning ATPase